MIPVCLLAFAIAAEEPVEQVLTLDNVITRAWNEAPAVSSAQANAQVAKTRIDVAAAPLWPTLSGQISANGNLKNSNVLSSSSNALNGNLQTALGYKGVTTNDSAQAGLEASWLVLDFGRTGESVRSAQLSASAAESDVDTARTAAAVAAGAAFLSLSADEQLVEANQRLVDDNMKLLEVAHGKVQAGTSAPIEEVRAKVSVETAKVGVLTAQAALKDDAASLAIALGIDPNRPLRIQPPTTLLAVDDDPVKAADDAEHTRPELEAARQRVHAAEAALASARAGHLPALVLNAGANVSPAYSSTGISGATLSEIGTLGGTFNIPIFDQSVNAQVSSAEAELLVAQAFLRQQSVDIRGAAAQAAIAVRSTAAAQSAAEQLVAQADEDYREAKGRYELGAASLLELTDAQAQESSATLSLISAHVQAEAARLRLMAAIGTLRPAATTR